VPFHADRPANHLFTASQFLFNRVVHRAAGLCGVGCINGTNHKRGDARNQQDRAHAIEDVVFNYLFSLT